VPLQALFPERWRARHPTPAARLELQQPAERAVRLAPRVAEKVVRRLETRAALSRFLAPFSFIWSIPTSRDTTKSRDEGRTIMVPRPVLVYVEHPYY
jgi:hypothetical protein